MHDGRVRDACLGRELEPGELCSALERREYGARRHAAELAEHERTRTRAAPSTEGTFEPIALGLGANELYSGQRLRHHTPYAQVSHT